MTYNIKFDVCTYILNDNNCMSTVFENISEAREKNLEGIGIVARGHTHTNDRSDRIIKNILNLPDKIKDIKILKGIECSMISLGRAEMDIPINTISDADFSMISFYQESFPNFVPDGNKISQTFKNCILSCNVDGIGQFTFGRATVDLRDLILFCKNNNKFIELSNDKLKNKKVSEADVYKIATLCKDFDVPIIVTSGARLYSDVGNFGQILNTLSEIEFPQKLILNESMDKFIDFVNKY